MARDAQLSIPDDAPLHRACALMRDALELLDAYSCSSAPADLDLAIHRLEREIESMAKS